jgi:hypothetical protein
MPSSKSLAEKLYIRENYSIYLVNAPEEYKSLLGSLPSGVKFVRTTKNQVDFIQVFVKDRDELESNLGKLKSHLKPDGWLWISYPKGSSKIKTDINRDSIWEYAKGLGLKAVRQISIDDTWSTIRFRFA